MQKKQHFCCATAIVLIGTLAGLSMYGSAQGADGQTSAQPRSGTTEYFSPAEFKANASSLTVITFDERGRGNGVLTGNEYAAKGLTIVQRDRHPINVLSAKDNQYYHTTNFNSQVNGISSASDVNNKDWPDRSDNFDFVFSKAVNAAGLWVGNLNGTTEIQFLSTGQCVIATREVDGNHKNLIKGGSEDPWDNRIFYGITTNQRIERIRVTNPPNDGDGIVLDDIQFGSAASKQLGERADQSIRIFAAVPSQDSAVFKSATHKSLRIVSPQGWDPIPYHMTQSFTTTITAKPGQRFFLAGDALGKTGWSLDNFLLVEIESNAGTQRLIIGHTNGSPVEYQGQRLRDIGPQSSSFSPESIDLSPYFPKNVPFRLTISALDYGSVGYVTDLFLVARDASGCPEAIDTLPKVAEIKFVRKTDKGFVVKKDHSGNIIEQSQISPDGGEVRTDEFGVKHSIGKDEDGRRKMISTDATGNQLTTVYDLEGNIVDEEEVRVTPKEPGEAYFENEIGGKYGEWKKLPQSQKLKYAQSEAYKKEALENQLRREAQEAQKRLEDGEYEKWQAEQRKILDEKLAAIKKEGEEADKEYAEWKKKEEFLNQRSEAEEKLQEYNRKIRDAIARSDKKEAERLSREADELHDKSHDLFQMTPEEEAEVKRKQELRDRLSNQISNYVRNALDTELMVTEELQNAKEAVTGKAKWVFTTAEMQEETKETTRRADRELALANLTRRRIIQLIEDPKITQEGREILHSKLRLADQQAYGASEHLTSNALLTAAGVGVDVVTTVTGAKLVTIGKKAVTAAAGKMLAKETAEKVVTATTEKGVLKLAGEGVTKAATKTTEKMVGKEAALKVEQALTYDVGKAASNASKSAAAAVLGEKGVQVAKNVASGVADIATTNLSDVPGKLKQTVTGTADSTGVVDNLAAGEAKQTAKGAVDQVAPTAPTPTPKEATKLPASKPTDSVKHASDTAKKQADNAPPKLEEEPVHGDRTMPTEQLADYAKNPRVRTSQRAGQVDEFPKEPVSRKYRRDDFVEARSQWKKIPKSEREAFDQSVRDAVDEAAAMGDKWAKRLQKDLNEGKIKYEYEPGLTDSGLAPGKGSLQINPLRGKKNPSLNSPDSVASTLIHEYAHSYKGPTKWKAETGLPYSGTATKGEYNEVRAFMAEAGFNKNLKRARQLNGKAFDDTMENELNALMKVDQLPAGPSNMAKGLQARKNMQEGLVDEYGYGADYATKPALGAERLSTFRGGGMKDIRQRLNDVKGPAGEITPEYEKLLNQIEKTGGRTSPKTSPSAKASANATTLPKKIDATKAEEVSQSLKGKNADAQIPEPQLSRPKHEVDDLMDARAIARQQRAAELQNMTAQELKEVALAKVSPAEQKNVWDHFRRTVPEINAEGIKVREELLRTPGFDEVLADIGKKGTTKEQGGLHTLRKAAEKIEKDGPGSIRSLEDWMPTPPNFKPTYDPKFEKMVRHGRTVRQGPDMVTKEGDIVQYKSYSDFNSAMRELTGFNKNGTPVMKDRQVEGGQILKDLLRYADRGWKDGMNLRASGKIRCHIDKNQLGREVTREEAEYMKAMSKKLTEEARAGLNKPDIAIEIVVD